MNQKGDHMYDRISFRAGASPQSRPGQLLCYGIYAYQMEPFSSKNILAIHDVFLNAADAISFVHRCNQLELSPVSLYDVIQDTLGI